MGFSVCEKEMCIKIGSFTHLLPNCLFYSSHKFVNIACVLCVYSIQNFNFSFLENRIRFCFLGLSFQYFLIL